jgi:hypothetical protein
MSPLSADAVRVLSAAAVVGRDFDLTLVSPACDLSNDRVLGSLSEALALGVVSEEPAAVGAYRFAHPLMREMIYDELPIPAGSSCIASSAKRSSACRARIWASTSPGSPITSPRWRLRGGGKALDYARQAGDQAMDAYAHEEAVAEYHRALRALGFAGPDEALRCELLLRLGRALARAGDYQEAKASYLSAIPIARQLGDTDRLALATLGFGDPQVEAGVVDRRLMDLLQEALDALGPGDGTSVPGSFPASPSN